jgi:hypothetical protein
MKPLIQARIGAAAGAHPAADHTGHLNLCLERGIERQIDPASAVDRPHDYAVAPHLRGAEPVGP